MSLLAPQSSNAKLSKNSDINAEWNTWIMYLIPSTGSGLADSSGNPVNLCPGASKGCIASCLNTAGRGAMGSVQAGRQRKTELYINDRMEFNRQLEKELNAISKRQQRTGVMQAIRLNGTSDVSWESHPIARDGRIYAGIPQAYPELRFYDYTKLPTRAAKSVTDKWPTNYHLTFSKSEANGYIVGNMIQLNMPVNIAIVFSGDSLPATYQGRVIVDGTIHDMRFLDPVGCIVGLLAKGRASRDKSGFVVHVDTAESAIQKAS